MPQDKVKVVSVQSTRDLKDFIQFPHQLYQQDPHWIPPLHFEQKNRIHPKKNPFFQNAQGQLFLAKSKGKIVGRVSAQINHTYEKIHGEKVGHFGFFETEDDPQITQALLKQAEQFCQTQGVQRMEGPFSYSINQESGLLVEGFQEPLMVMTPYNPPYYAAHLESMGYTKVKDLLAWKYQTGQAPEEILEIAQEVKKDRAIEIRSVQPKNLYRDLKKMIEVYNSAWSENWGYVPMSDAEIKNIAHELKLVLDPEITFMILLQGEVAGICLSVPNLYEAIGDFNGNLLPFNWVKLLWSLKRKKINSARLMLLGVQEKFRHYAMGGLSILLYEQIAARGKRAGYQWGELSWTLEDNDRINNNIQWMGAKKYKVFRIYEKKL